MTLAAVFVVAFVALGGSAWMAQRGYDLKKALERDAAGEMYRHFKKLLEDDLFEVRYSAQGGCPGCYQSIIDYENAAGITR